jgi:hypothetical protein
MIWTSEGGTVSGRGKREKVLKADAARWRDKVCADIASAAGSAAMSEHRISAQLVNDVVNAVVGYIAAGEDRAIAATAAGAGPQNILQRAAMSKS